MLLVKLETIGLIPVAMVCDLGPKNRKLWSDMNVTETKPTFETPGKNSLFVFGDAPHLIKSLRNHFIDKGYFVHGKHVGPEPLKRLVSSQRIDIKIAHKLSEKHFPKESLKRQKVSLATQLFSNSVSAGIRKLASMKLSPPMPSETEDTAIFLKLTNDWFDIFNSAVPVHDQRPTKKAFGFHDAYSEQLDILMKMKDTTENTVKIRTTNSLPCQKGIIQSINALTGLLEYLRKIGSVYYICTRRLNQDILERFFGYVRAKGRLHDHPSPLEFLYRLRKCIMGEHWTYNLR